MLLVGLENCPGCKTIHETHPEVSYVTLPRNYVNVTKDIQGIYDAVNRLNVTKFPVLMNDSLTAVLPLETIDPLLKGYNEDEGE